MHLVTTALREFWPDGGPIWLLSSGCLPDVDDPEVNNRWQIKGLVSDPFQAGSETTAAYAEIWRISLDLTSLLAARLNHIHGTDRSERYWRTHIGFWVLLHVTTVFDRHARLLKARAEAGDIRVIGCAHRNPAIPPDTAGFCSEASNDFYNAQLYTYMCDRLGILVAEYRTAEAGARPREILSLKRSAIEQAFRTIANCVYAPLSSVCAKRADVLMVASYLPRWFEVALSLTTAGKVFPLYTQDPVDAHSSSPIDQRLRSTLSVVPEGYGGVSALAIEMIGLCIPRSFVEDYRQLCSRSDRIYGNYRPRAIYSANAWWFNEPFKHWAATCREEGTKLIGAEHGSASFLNKYGIFESMEILISDCFLTWGWTDAQAPKIFQVPANKLIGISRRPARASGDKILYVGTAEARHNVAMLEDFSAYLEWQKRFFIGVAPSLLEEFLVRTHYADYGWAIRDRLAKIAPGLRFDSWDVSFRDRLRDFRLYVFDYLSTTFVEALSSNAPTILFLDQHRYPILEAAQPQIRALTDCHVLHDTPESAAAWAADVYADPEPWWSSESCQKAVTQFCSLYGRTSESPLRDWRQTLEALVTRSM